MHYVALIWGDAESGYGVTVPDITGFTAHAEAGGIDAAIEIAKRVLADHIEALVDAGKEIPAARSLAEIKADASLKEEIAEAEALVMLPAVIPAGRTLRVNISMDEGTLRAADAAAAERKLTRSAFIAEACRQMALGSSDPTFTIHDRGPLILETICRREGLSDQHETLWQAMVEAITRNTANEAKGRRRLAGTGVQTEATDVAEGGITRERARRKAEL